MKKCPVCEEKEIRGFRWCNSCSSIGDKTLLFIVLERLTRLENLFDKENKK